MRDASTKSSRASLGSRAARSAWTHWKRISDDDGRWKASRSLAGRAPRALEQDQRGRGERQHHREDRERDGDRARDVPSGGGAQADSEQGEPSSTGPSASHSTAAGRPEPSAWLSRRPGRHRLARREGRSGARPDQRPHVDARPGRRLRTRRPRRDGRLPRRLLVDRASRQHPRLNGRRSRSHRCGDRHDTGA